MVIISPEGSDNLSYTELFKIISKPWAGIKEIQLIANCGRDSAIVIRNAIEKEIKESGKKLPITKTILVPMRKVIEYLDLDVDYIIEMSNKESNLKTMRNINASIQK